MEQKACVPAKAVTAKASRSRSQWHSLGNAMWLLITLFISKISSKKSPEVLLPAGTKCKTNTHRESQVVLAHIQVWPPRDVFTVPFPAGSAGNRDFCLIVCLRDNCMYQESFSNKVAENFRTRASGWERKHNSSPIYR